MPVKVEIALREGWKAKLNDRLGDILELRFIDESTGRVMFRYAPKHDDKPVFDLIFDKLRQYDELVVKIKMLASDIDGNQYALCGASDELNKLNDMGN